MARAGVAGGGSRPWPTTPDGPPVRWSLGTAGEGSLRQTQPGPVLVLTPLLTVPGHLREGGAKWEGMIKCVSEGGRE